MRIKRKVKKKYRIKRVPMGWHMECVQTFSKRWFWQVKKDNKVMFNSSKSNCERGFWRAMNKKVMSEIELNFAGGVS